MFFAGMALGAMAGAAFGIGLMCCVVAGKREDQQMEQMRIRRQKQGERKTIHFRDMEGLERFSLLDGESLCMIAEDGTKAIGICRFVDAYPTPEGECYELERTSPRYKGIILTDRNQEGE